MKAISWPLMLKSTILASRANMPTMTAVASPLKAFFRALSNRSTAAPAKSALLSTRNSHNTNSSEVFPVRKLKAAGTSTLIGEVKLCTLWPGVNTRP